MKKTLFIISLLVLSQLSFGQDFKSQFDELFEAGDTSKQIELLKKWESQDPKNPELYTSYFNYYFQKARQERISLTGQELKGKTFQITDSTGNVAGYLGSEIHYDSEQLKKGLDKIEEGIELYPDRLDMRFGKIYTLGQAEMWTEFTEEIIKTVRYSKVNNNDWKWTYNEKQENGQEFFLSSLQDYQLQLYQTENDSLLKNMRTIAEEILKIYPNHIESLTNISITYLLIKEYQKGIDMLLKAEKINPNDIVVLSNIAHGYKLKGDFANSIKYYEKVVNSGDQDAVNFAKQQIEILRKKQN